MVIDTDFMYLCVITYARLNKTHVKINRAVQLNIAAFNWTSVKIVRR